MSGLHNWWAFVMASSLIAVLPGPGVANIVGHAVSSGRRTAFAAIAGAVSGNVVAMTVALAGAGALLAASPQAFRDFELAGAACLSALGLAAILRTRPAAAAAGNAHAPISPRTAFLGSVAVSALNPKSLVFFVAFVPQFILPDETYFEQASVLLVTFASIVAISDTFYALVALRVAALLSSPKTIAWVRRAGGIILVVTGLLAASAGWAAP